MPRFYLQGTLMIMYPNKVTAKYTVHPLASLNLTKKQQKPKSHDTKAATIFLMVVLIVSAMTIAITPRSTEATLLSDYCDRFGVLCEEETPPAEEPPAEEPPRTTGDALRFIWRTTESQTEQRNFANKYLDSRDLIVVHYPQGGDPTSEQINALKGVTTVPNSRKALEFFSLAEIKEHAPTVKKAGFGFIAYDLEPISPGADVADPVKAVKTAKQYATAAGVKLMVVPSQKIVREYGVQFAPYVDWLAMQSQIHQDNDSTCTYMKNWINDRITAIERANSNLAGKITAQVTLTQYSAPGKTVYQTAQGCLDAVSGGKSKVDGMAFWWNPNEWNNDQVASLTSYYERKYS
jgi:hypothetical protein